jgi:predicted ATPase/DNA-binding CsgD family transcriptional regulator
MALPSPVANAGSANALLHHATWPERIEALPRFLTRLVGRDRQLADITGLLREPRVRLLTLVGPGGVGKTRLAVAAAELVDADFRDGALFIPLGSVVDSALVVPTIAAALKVENGEGSVERRVAYRLAGRQILLVLDNFEQVVPAGPAIADLLRSTAAVTAMVTSRTPLRVGGEQVYPVAPLDLPDAARTPGPADILESEAGALFVERARASWPGFTLHHDNAATVFEICRRLDGLPLALELAASRINVLPADDLLARLSNQLQVLSTGPQDAPARQRTMGAAIAWSYGLLSSDHQALFRRLAVFRGGFSLAVAEQIIASEPAGIPPSLLIEGVGELLDQSLIARDEQRPDESRFRMLEPVREFGLEQLEAHGEDSAIFTRCAAYWKSQAEASWDAIGSFDALTQALNELEVDHDNLRAALDWLEIHDTSMALDLAGTLLWFWYRRGHHSEGLHRLDHLLALAPENTPSRVLARARLAAATIGHKTQTARAEQLARDSLATWHELNDEWCAGFTLLVLGTIAEDEGDYDRANGLLLDALPHLEAGEDRGTIGSVQLRLASVAFGRGDYEASLSLLSSLLEETDRPALRVMPWVRHLRGLVACAQGEATATALKDLQQSLHYILLASASSDVAMGLAGVAVAVSAWDTATATRLIAVAERLNEERGEQFLLPHRAAYEQSADCLLQQMGRKTFDAEYAAGREWSVDQALECALRFQPPVEPERVDSPGGLSVREAEVLRLLATGKTNDEIAVALDLSSRTVQTHLTNIYRKIDVSRRSEAVRFAIDNGLA